jgi:hypothetical protein
MDLQRRISARQYAGRTRVVQVDVGEDEPAKLLEGEPVCGKRRFKRADAARRPAVDEGRLIAVEQVGGDDPGPPEVEQIEELEALT